MARFITRVELHAADDDDYEKLHSAMEMEGFERTITSDEGVIYHLPTAEYYREIALTRQDVLDAAKRAATKNRKNFGAIVTESNGITWSSLNKAK
jgi:hypothetical protein